MAKQNRVTPFGAIIATPARGSLMGNRGVLHDDAGRIRRPWQVRRWIACRLDFKDRKRSIMAAGQYTELFFLDDATALAAGHRPCAECRRARFNAFCAAWRLAHQGTSDSPWPTAEEIDRQLHAERPVPDRSKQTHLAALDELPDGVFITLAESQVQAYLVWGNTLLPWSPAGYREARRRPANREVMVLTPKSTVAAIRAGYQPEIHRSANGRKAERGYCRS
jgi:hypothetical protein